MKCGFGWIVAASPAAANAGLVPQPVSGRMRGMGGKWPKSRLAQEKDAGQRAGTGGGAWPVCFTAQCLDAKALCKGMAGGRRVAGTALALRSRQSGDLRMGLGFFLEVRTSRGPVRRNKQKMLSKGVVSPSESILYFISSCAGFFSGVSSFCGLLSCVFFFFFRKA